MIGIKIQGRKGFHLTLLSALIRKQFSAPKGKKTEDEKRENEGSKTDRRKQGQKEEEKGGGRCIPLGPK